MMQKDIKREIIMNYYLYNHNDWMHMEIEIIKQIIMMITKNFVKENAAIKREVAERKWLQGIQLYKTKKTMMLPLTEIKISHT
jgi:hypothetical protein